MNKVFIIGDSTVEDNKPPFRGWGWAFKQLVKEGIEVCNHALSGRSSRSFMEEGLFAPVEQNISEGDILLIQFGHNDEKEDERHTDPETTFRERLLYYCETAQKNGAFPVLMTPVERRFFTGDGGLLYTHGEYPLAVRKLAEEKGIAFFDLNKVTRKLYLEKGPEETAKLFVQLQPGENPDFPEGHDDKTHFNATGAAVIAGLVAEALKGFEETAAVLR